MPSAPPNSTGQIKVVNGRSCYYKICRAGCHSGKAALLAALIIATMSILRWVWLLQRQMEAEAVAAAEAKQTIQQRARQHLQDLSDALPLAIFQLRMGADEKHSRFTYASAKTREILGLSATSY